MRQVAQCQGGRKRDGSRSRLSRAARCKFSHVQRMSPCWPGYNGTLSELWLSERTFTGIVADGNKQHKEMTEQWTLYE